MGSGGAYPNGVGGGTVTADGDWVANAVNSEGSITGTVSLDSTYFAKMSVASGSSDYTITLPAASGNGGKMLAIRFTNTGMTTVDGNSLETISGELTRYYMEGDMAWFYCDGSNYYVQQSLRPVGARAYRATAQTSVSSVAKIQLDTETYDHNGDFDSSTNYDFTAPATGYYHIQGSAYFVTPPADMLMTLYIYVNGSSVTATGMEEDGGATATYNQGLTLGDVYRVTKGQKIDLRASRSSSGNIAGGANSTFISIRRLEDNF